MENVPQVPDVQLDGYTVTRATLDNRWLGEEQSRRRVFQFGHLGGGRRLEPHTVALETMTREGACLASEGRSGQIVNRRQDGKCHSVHKPRRDFQRFCELQGLPKDFLAGYTVFTSNGKYRMVGNGVPLPMGRAIARAVREALATTKPQEVPR
jgi:DNA (cytosine-5)-methyltransferase 1